MTGTKVSLTLEEGTAWITLDGPERRNALDAQAARDLAAICDIIDADPAAGVAVITGTGRAFCSGADTAILNRIRAASPDQAYDGLDELYAGFRRFAGLKVPTVAAVNGAAVGAGLNLALAADLRVASAGAVFISGFAPLGMHPGGGHLHLIARAAGAAAAAYLGMFGQRMSAGQAFSALIRTADVHFDNVRVCDADLLGPAGGGMQTFLSTFNVSRLGNASELIGFGRRALELALRYAQQRQVGDNMVTDFQGIQWMVADSWTALEAASLARDLAAVVYDQGQDTALHTTAAKQLAIIGAESASRTAYSMTGGHSLYFDQPYTDIDNDIKVLKVAGGSSEIMRNYIARRILKDPGHEGVN